MLMETYKSWVEEVDLFCMARAAALGSWAAEGGAFRDSLHVYRLYALSQPTLPESQAILNTTDCCLLIPAFSLSLPTSFIYPIIFNLVLTLGGYFIEWFIFIC